MSSETAPRIVIDDIRREKEGAKDTTLWPEYLNMLEMITEVVFTRSSGFVLELIQNAEDVHATEFCLTIDQAKVVVKHNGRPFSNDDARAICAVNSSKRPEQGTLGYLGIGFKSVFKITESPEIHSGGFHFKFDIGLCDNPDETPWQVTPIWIESDDSPFALDQTYFVIPFARDANPKKLSEELAKLNMQLFLFLSNLRRIVIEDKIIGKTTKFTKEEQSADGLAVFSQDGEEKRFKVVSKI